MAYRDKTRVVRIGDRSIGGGNPIQIQSMTNTKTENVEATVRQILELEAAGCDIIRCAVPTMEAAQALKEIKPAFGYQCSPGEFKTLYAPYGLINYNKEFKSLNNSIYHFIS